MSNIDVVISSKVLTNRNEDNYPIFCYRVFNESFEKGGRFYFIHQNIKKYEYVENGVKEYKKPIKSIGFNKKTKKRDTNLTELDFKSMHPNLILNSCGIKCQSNLYDVPDVHRNVVKMFIIICFNAKSRKFALSALRIKLLNAKDKFDNPTPLMKGDFDKINNHFKITNPILYNNFYTGIGILLQKKDSDILNKIMKECVDNLIPMVPYHDSIVVKTINKDKAYNIMMKAYKEVAGFDPIIEEVPAGNLI